MQVERGLNTIYLVSTPVFDIFEINVAKSLPNTSSFHVHDCFSDFFSICAGKHKLSFSPAGSSELAVFVDTAVCVASENNRLFPAAHCAVDIAYKNRLSKD